MKTVKQMLRQPMRTLTGMLLITIVVTLLRITA